MGFPHSPQNLRSGALLPPQLEQTTRASYQSPTLQNGSHRRGRRDSLWYPAQLWDRHYIGRCGDGGDTNFENLVNR